MTEQEAKLLRDAAFKKLNKKLDEIEIKRLYTISEYKEELNKINRRFKNAKR